VFVDVCVVPIEEEEVNFFLRVDYFISDSDPLRERERDDREIRRVHYILEIYIILYYVCKYNKVLNLS